MPGVKRSTGDLIPTARISPCIKPAFMGTLVLIIAHITVHVALRVGKSTLTMAYVF